MYRKQFNFLLILLVAVTVSSCLTCEKKEYIFQLTGENSGRLTIRYINIFSNSIDSVGELQTDLDELLNMWLHGEKIEHDFPKATKVRKRLFEQNYQLCGEVTMEFDNLESVRLFRFHNQGPYMFSMSAVNDDGENFLQCNGEYGGEKMPVIFWQDDNRTLRFTTYIARPDSSCVSLLEKWKLSEKQK
jgi:hypothetical protein